MVPNKITKDEVEKFLKIPGAVRGVVFKTDFEYVKERLGLEGVNTLKAKIKEWDIPIDYERIKVTNWYPIGLRVLSLLVIKEVFNWRDDEIFNLGNSAPKHSFVVAMLMKHFLSFQKTFEAAPKYWKHHYTVGEMEPAVFNEKEKYALIRLKNFRIHPIFCTFLKGYLLRIAQFGLKAKQISIKETKCQFQGDSYHEYLVRWE